MEVTIKVLDSIFRGIHPDRIIELIRHPQRLADGKHQKRLLEQYCSSALPNYSLNEQEVILRQICHSADRLAAEGFFSFEAPARTQEALLPRDAIYTALRLAQEFLVCQGQEALCRTEQTLAWREASLLLGQDLFVCAFLAWEDLRRHRRRDSFAWPAVIRTDHRGLNAVLERGLAENHQHLYGSSQTFALSWCSMMNDPKTHPTAGKLFQELFAAFPVVGSEDKAFSAKERVQQACLCRAFLFEWDKAQAGRGDAACGASLAQELRHAPPETVISRKLPVLRGVYGMKVPQPAGRPECLDYALEPSVFCAAPDALYRVLAGERSLIYRCFCRLFQKQMSPTVQTVFYLYLVLKSMFRGEMIQINRKVGFQNFANYQDRKIKLCNSPCFEAELVRMAVNASMNEGHVHFLETRCSPLATPIEDYKVLRRVDALHDFAGHPAAPPPPEPEARDYFFVFHFIKKPDKTIEAPPDWPQCRYDKLRKTVRRQAVSLAKALSRSAWLCGRVRGIDAASNEVTCPPEVFAAAFRFLRGFRPSDFSADSMLHQPAAPRIGATFHVGEDFMDIAGALRAIDETIHFLELSRGDRLGHGLGLGVDPELHYRQKGRRIFQSKQERLDDLVWLTYRARELGAHIDAQLYGELKKEAEILFLQLYGHTLAEHGGQSLSEYYCAMQLRGDDPALYISGQYQPPRGILHPYDEFGIRRGPDLGSWREYKPAAQLYHSYHFDQRVKRAGSEPVEVSVNEPYIRLMGDIQEALQEHIRDRGLIIECNPSSNVLIGTFRTYDKHPIFRFNNAGFEQDEAKRKSCKQLQVCVNTDDLGVFDTSQEFEYALLFQTLAQMKTADGGRMYHETDILDYLESLREMGLQAVFPSAREWEPKAAP